MSYNNYEEPITLEEAMDSIEEYLEAAKAKYGIEKRGKRFVGIKKTYKNGTGETTVLNPFYGKPGSKEIFTSITPDRKRKIKDGKEAILKKKKNSRIIEPLEIEGNDGKTATVTQVSLPRTLKKKGNYAYESVNELRLQVFEAYEAGTIDAYEKRLFLEYLDIENYE